VVIGDFVWIAMEVSIMPGTNIEPNCIINPGVVLQGRVKSNSMIQQDATQYSIHDLSRLQRISKKSVQYYHDQMISSFLDSQSMSFKHEVASNSYSFSDSCVFISHPDTNCVELINKNKKKIVYDFEHFYADNSRNILHKKFLLFIRLRFGIILRTRYS
jgi:hypothetical protein